MQDEPADSDSDEEEPSEVDSDEESEIGQGEIELQCEDGEGESQAPRRLRSKTPPLIDLPQPEYRDYPKQAWPALWKGKPAPKPGQRGFNPYAAECVQGVLDFWKYQGFRTSHKIYQKTPLACAHPLSPCKALLVDARMGAGKTKVLISILDQHFQDQRKKLPLFPKQALVWNFMDELLRWPSKYRSYFALMQPAIAAKAVPLPDGLTVEEQRLALERCSDKEWNVPAAEADAARRRLRTELEMTDIRKLGGA